MATEGNMHRAGRVSGQRSFTGHHQLLPAAEAHAVHLYTDILEDLQPGKNMAQWALGRDTVIWRLWPAVILYTSWAAIVVVVSMKTTLRLNIPPILMTVLGVLIGFVISYRATSGYDRYWMGRGAWGDIIKNSRIVARLIWFHVPLLLTPKTPEEIKSGEVTRSMEEVHEVMVEKRMALDLVEGFAVALKHHLRNESGIYYADLYHLISPLHEHEHKRQDNSAPKAATSSAAPNGGSHHEATGANGAGKGKSPSSSQHYKEAGHDKIANEAIESDERSRLLTAPDPAVPAINAYGSTTGQRPVVRISSVSSGLSSHSHRGEDGRVYDRNGQLRSLAPPVAAKKGNFFTEIESDLIPFAAIFTSFVRTITRPFRRSKPRDEEQGDADPQGEDGGVQRKWARSHLAGEDEERMTHAKHRPRVACGGENLPVAILQCLSDYMSVLEDRNTVPGTTMGNMIPILSNLEDSIAVCEKILTTPLPFVFSVHIRHTVWIYLFFLPFQLLEQFNWYSIPGVAIASFIYLGFLASGEEVEQPFGYDENDLDLDLFCRGIVHADMERLKHTPCHNAYLGSYRRGGEVLEDELMHASSVHAPDVFGHVDAE